MAPIHTPMWGVTHYMKKQDCPKSSCADFCSFGLVHKLQSKKIISKFMEPKNTILAVPLAYTHTQYRSLEITGAAALNTREPIRELLTPQIIYIVG